MLDTTASQFSRFVWVFYNPYVSLPLSSSPQFSNPPKKNIIQEILSLRRSHSRRLEIHPRTLTQMALPGNQTTRHPRTPKTTPEPRPTYRTLPQKLCRPQFPHFRLSHALPTSCSSHSERRSRSRSRDNVDDRSNERRDSDSSIA